MKKKKNCFIQKIFHCPETSTPFEKMMHKWYPDWTRINGYEKPEDAQKGLESILKKKYDYDKKCYFRVVDIKGEVLSHE